MSQDWYCPVCQRNLTSSRTFLSHLKGKKNQECKFFYTENPSAEPIGPYNPNKEERDAPLAANQPLPKPYLPPTRDNVNPASPQTISHNTNTFTPTTNTLTPNEADSPSFSLNEAPYDD